MYFGTDSPPKNLFTPELYPSASGYSTPMVYEWNGIYGNGVTIFPNLEIDLVLKHTFANGDSSMSPITTLTI